MPLSTQPIKTQIRELTIFAALGAIMFITRFLLQWLPSVHLLGLIIASTTLVFRARALIPLYVYVMLEGVFAGFSPWWIPYVYIWLPLWGMFMAAGKIRLSNKAKVPIFMVLCALHGFLFGTLYAPVQALMFGLNFQGMIAWIIAGLPFDTIHGISNFAVGSLIIPLSELLRRLNDRQTPLS